MVKVKAPALSLDASGSLADTLVFSKWKGRPYVRTLVRPTNPKSGGQIGVRSMFKFLSQVWANIIAGSQATWDTRADAKVISPFNAYMGYNQFRFRDFLAPTSHDPAATTDTAAVIGTTVATAGVRSITLDVPITTENDGWGVMIFKDLSASFTTAWDNLVAIVAVSGTDTLYFIDSPLVPDTYYYNFRDFTLDGQLGAEDGEINATVT